MSPHLSESNTFPSKSIRKRLYLVFSFLSQNILVSKFCSIAPPSLFSGNQKSFHFQKLSPCLCQCRVLRDKKDFPTANTKPTPLTPELALIHGAFDPETLLKRLDFDADISSNNLFQNCL